MPVRKIEVELSATNSCWSGDHFGQVVGKKQYEIANHLGNVLATVSDRRLSVDNYSYTSWSSGTKYSYDGQRNIYYQDAINGTFQRTLASSDNKTDWYTADVISYSDYYAYGEQQHGRFGGVYRFGFNGMEKVDEHIGSGDSYDFGARIYDPRVARFLSVDPRSPNYPALATYCYAANTPIAFIDRDGEGPEYAAIADQFKQQLNKYGVKYTETVTADQIQITASMTVNGVTYSRTYTFSGKQDTNGKYVSDPDDWHGVQLLCAWGVPYQDAMMIGTHGYLNKLWRWAYQYDQQLDGNVSEGAKLMLNVALTVATMGEGVVLMKAGWRAWATIEGAFIATNIATLMYDSYTTLYVNNKNFFSTKLGISEETLKTIETTNKGVEFLYNLRKTIVDAIDPSKNLAESITTTANLILSEIDFTINAYKNLEKSTTEGKSPVVGELQKK